MKRVKSTRFIIIVALSIVFVLSAIALFIHFTKEIIPQKAFYFWQSEPYYLSDENEQVLIDNNIEKLYVKFFEVEKNEALGIFPSAKSNLELPKNLAGLEIIPTVYIRNEVFKNSAKKELDEFADNLLFLITKKFKENFKVSSAYQEIQMDCDWTISTQENYFYFLRKIKEMSKLTLSATLRLYPYKFPEKMGVLPVDRAMLMCYNLLPPLDAGQKNSILDLDELTKYLVGAEKYPLPLDLAMPVYSSALIYKNEQFAAIHYQNEFGLENILEEIKSPVYLVKKDTLLPEIFLRAGDKVKLEKTDPILLEKALKIIRKNVSFEEGATLSLFHLTSVDEKPFGHEEITALFSPLSR